MMDTAGYVIRSVLWIVADPGLLGLRGRDLPLQRERPGWTIGSRRWTRGRSSACVPSATSLASTPTWTYERSVDVAAVRRFNENLGGTLLGRLVERSPLPGGRHRWASVGRVPDVEVEEVPRPRDPRLDRRVRRPGHRPQRGPGWRVGVLPLTDGERRSP